MKKYIKFYIEIQGPIIAKIILDNNNESAKGITVPDFKLHQRAIVIETSWYWCENRLIDQWNSGPTYKLTIFQSSDFDKEAKIDIGKKDSTMKKIVIT